MSETSELIESLPLAKKASPKQMLILLAAMLTLSLGGWKAKGYFDEWHHDLLAQIDKSGKDIEMRFATVAAQTNQNTASIESIRKYYWSNSDQQHWAQQLDRANRQLTVPEVPAPAVR